MPKTKLDLHIGASAVALQQINNDDLAHDAATLEAFNAGGFDRAGWDFFRSQASAQRGAYQQFAKLPAPVTPAPAAKPAPAS